MMKKYLKIKILLLCILYFNNTYGYTVKYNYYPTVSDFKGIQNLGTIKSDSVLNFTEYSYIIKLIGEDNISGYQIPQFTKIEKILIHTFGMNKIQRIIEYHLIKISNNKYGLDNREKILYTNLINYRDIRINVESDVYSTIKLYPISPEYYSSTYQAEIEFDEKMQHYPTILTLYSPIEEYYNVNGILESNLQTAKSSYKMMFNGEYSQLKQPTEINIEKKYEIVNFEREYFDGTTWNSKVILPYYEMKLDLKKGENRLLLSYETYVQINNDIDGTTIQIK